jgi:hypothetical protein
MKRASRFAIALALIFTSPAQAQEPAEGQPATPAPAASGTSFDATSLFDVGASEWMVAGGPAWSASILQSATGHHYALQTVSWGRILMGPRGAGILRGRFEWAIEGVPFYAQYSPQNTYGFGITPLLWRWNFEPVGRLAPYVELGGGALWTRDPVPVRTTTSNFTGHTGAGVRIFIGPSEAVVLGYRFHHISNGNRLEANPGVNAHVLQFGWSHLRPRRP